MARFLFLAVLPLLGAAISFVRPSSAQHPWPTMRGPLMHQYGSSSVVLPENLSEALVWSFHHPSGRFNSLVAGGAVVDSEMNLYVSMNDGVRKLSTGGTVLWHFEQPHRRFNNQASLYGNKVYSTNQKGEAFAIDMASGKPAWVTKLAADAGGDCGYPAAFDGVFVAGAKVNHDDPVQDAGNKHIFGVDAETGRQLWRYTPQHPVWNFEPLFPGDGSVIFMDFWGGLYSLGLHDGKERWYNPAQNMSFTDGGATLGPDGSVYSCSNAKNSHGNEGEQGILRAVKTADGSELWRQKLPQPCNSYPAVGPVNGELSVAVTPGSFMGNKHLHGSIMLFDAATGASKWRWNGEPFEDVMARGDIKGLPLRLVTQTEHAICLPAHWSSANIDGNGAVVAGRSDGFIYAVQGPPNLPQGGATSLAATTSVDFASTAGVRVRSWDAKAGFTHGAFAFAPGMVAVSSCDTLYVFRA